MRKRIVISFLIIFILVSLSITTYGQPGMNTAPNDIKEHWAEKILTEWIDMGLLVGFPDGTIRPNSIISKAEFVTLVNRIFGYNKRADTNYQDVLESHWYAIEAAIAKGNGYMDWYKEEKLFGTQQIERQEVCAILYNIMQLEGKQEKSLSDFLDSNSIPDWSKGYIAAAVENKYMTGYTDKTLRVENGITRAEAIIMLNRAMGELVYTSGIYGSVTDIDTIKGNITINTSDIIIQNKVIEGDLIIAAGVGEGNVELDNVVVKGRTIITGGGENSILIKNSDMGDIIVFKLDGKIRVVSSNSRIGRVLQRSGGKLEGNFAGAIIEVVVQGQEVELEGDFDKLIITSKAEIEITGDTKVQSLEIQKEAEGTQIVTQQGTGIGEIIFNTPTIVTGQGTIEKAIVNSNGVSVEKEVGQKITAEGFDSSGVRIKPPKSYTDKTSPSGYSVDIDQPYINSSNESAISFTFSGAELNATYNYSIDDTNLVTDSITGSGIISAGVDQITNIDVSGLDEDTLTLTVYLTDTAGNQGNNVTDTVVKDKTAPSGYSISIDQSPINSSNEKVVSFTFSGAETGTTYDYTISSDGGAGTVENSGTVITGTDPITNVDVSGLLDGELTVSVKLTDDCGNTGSDETAKVNKDATVPLFVSVDDGGGDNSYKAGETVTFDINLGETGLTVTANLTVLDSDFSSTQSMTDDLDGTYSYTTPALDVGNHMQVGTNIEVTITAVDTAGNSSSDSSLTLHLDKTLPSGYSISIYESPINSSNENALSFTFSDAEIGTTYDYTISSDGGAGTVENSGTVITETDQITNVDVSGLPDGELTVSVSLTDDCGNTGNDQIAKVDKDATAPEFKSVDDDGDNSYKAGETIILDIDLDETGLTVTADLTVLDSDFSHTQSMTDDLDGTYSYTTPALDVGGNMEEGTSIAVTITADDDTGNSSSVSCLTLNLDKTPPSGYGISIDQSPINSSNEKALSFTFSGAEIGTTYDYTISSDGGAGTLKDTGTVTNQITNIDVSGLPDGELTVSVKLTDDCGNTGSDVTAKVNKDATAPKFDSVDDGGGDNSYKAGETITLDIDLKETGLTVTADLTVLDSNFSSTQSMTDDLDGTYSYTTLVLDDGGNMREGTSIDVTITAVDIAGNSSSDSSLTLNLDKTAPSVSSITPVDEAVNVAINSNIVIVFNESLDHTITTGWTVSCANGSFSFTSANATLSYTASNTIAIDPDDDLSNETTYGNITIDGFKDLAGNTISSYNDLTYNFITQSAGPTKVTVSGAADDVLNGVYSLNGYSSDGRPIYTKDLDRVPPEIATIKYNEILGQWELLWGFVSDSIEIHDLMNHNDGGDEYPPTGAWEDDWYGGFSEIIISW